MEAQFIIGLSGTGKTTFCLEAIKDEIKNRNENPLIYLVPEQFTLMSERMVAGLIENSGLFNAEVLSFSRLAFRFFSAHGHMNKKVMGDVGKIMLIRKIIYGLEKELNFYGNTIDKKGFLGKLKDIITEFFQFSVKTSEIDISNIKQATLKSKWSDITKIYEGYCNFLKDSYVSSDDLLDVFAESIEKEQDYLKDSVIWIDNFHGFTAQEYKVISKLSTICQKIYITLVAPPIDHRNSELIQGDFFYETKNSMKRLNAIFKDNGVNIKPPIFLYHNQRLKGNSAILALEQNFFSFNHKLYDGETDSLKIFAAIDIFEEIKMTANEIISLTRDKNIRYKDIAILLCDEGSYAKPLKNIMQEFEIPIFMDERKPIYQHPLIEYIRALLETIISRKSFESVSRYLKTGLTGIADEDVFLLENYMLAYGIKGRDWEQPFKWGFDSGVYDFDKMEGLRVTLLNSLSDLTEKIKSSSKYKIQFICERLYSHLKTHNISERLEAQNNRLIGLPGFIQDELLKVWNSLIELLGKMADTLGNEQVTLKEFIKLFEAGLSESHMGAIPQCIDNVIVGDLRRTRLPEIKALFVLGMNDNNIPESKGATGLFSENDRKELLSAGIEMGLFGLRKSCEEQFLAYLAFSKPREQLVLGYSLFNADLAEQRPSYIINRIKKIFKDIKQVTTETQEEICKINKPSIVFKELNKKITDYVKTGEMTPFWKDIYTWFYKMDREKTKDLTELAFAYTDFEKISARRLAPETSGNLFKSDIYSSVSRLEKYAACPFSYFASYSLYLKERKVYTLNTPDLGILFHNMLDLYSKKLEEAGFKWHNITQKKMEELVYESVYETTGKMDILASSYKNKYLVERFKRVSKRAVWALTKHVQKGDFIPFAYEQGFGAQEALPPIVIDLENGRKIILTGRIDRIDTFEGQDCTYVKIVDYKSGNAYFSLQDIYYGLQLQLLVYLDAFLKSSQNYSPGGIFYFRIKDPFINIMSIDDEVDSVVEEKLLKELKLSGLILSNKDVVNALEKDLQGYSSIIPVQVKKDGELGKNSSVATQEQFNDLMRHTVRIAKQLAGELSEGVVAVSPVKLPDKTACDYCLYGQICGFDIKIPGCEYRVLKRISTQNVWESLAKMPNEDKS